MMRVMADYEYCEDHESEIHIYENEEKHEHQYGGEERWLGEMATRRMKTESRGINKGERRTIACIIY